MYLLFNKYSATIDNIAILTPFMIVSNKDY